MLKGIGDFFRSSSKIWTNRDRMSVDFASQSSDISAMTEMALCLLTIAGVYASTIYNEVIIFNRSEWQTAGDKCLFPRSPHVISYDIILAYGQRRHVMAAVVKVETLCLLLLTLSVPRGRNDCLWCHANYLCRPKWSWQTWGQLNCWAKYKKKVQECQDK